MEIEIKLLVDSEDVAALRRHPLLKHYAVSAPRTQRLVSIYFDTPELALQRSAGALRVRRAGRQWMQTFKAGGQVDAGLHQREEWESPVPGPSVDLAALSELVEPGSAWAAMLSDPTLADRLVPIFTTRFRRRIWLLRSVHGDEVELALDQGAVQHGNLQVPISEIELELKGGSPDALFELALALQETIPLRVGSISKAERGYALYAPQAPLPAKALPLGLATDLTVEQGFQAIVGNCLAQIQANEIGVAHGVDPESVHQMRIGLRRLRSALGLFGKLTPCPPALRTELAWLGTALGEARDWEVLATVTLSSSMQGAGLHAPKLAELRHAALQVAQARRQRAATAVDSVRYSRLVLTLGAWIFGRRWRDAASADGVRALSASLRKFAARKLARLYRALCKRGQNLKSGKVRARHRVRIAAKNLRYAAEFFQTYFPGRKSRDMVDALASVQELLGRLNDVAVASRLLRDLAHRRVDLAEEANLVRVYLDAGAKRDVRKLRKTWRTFVQL